MNSLDFLHYSLSIGFLVLVGAFIFVSIYVAKTLSLLAKNINVVAKTALFLKEGVKFNGYSLLGKIITLLRRGGEV